MRKSGAARIVTLDRPGARHALDIEMKQALAAAIPQFARDADTYAILFRSTRPGAFCAGGDVRELARQMVSEPAAAKSNLADEYRLVWLLECFSKPVISLIDGVVMGGGAGITLVNTHRVAAEDYGFAMPEVHIGFFPDDGVAHRLARLDDNVGTYLALTGRRLHRADAFALGLVTHCIDAADFDAIERAIADAQPIDPLLETLHRDPGPGDLSAIRPLIAECFAGPTVEAIIARVAALHASAGEAASRDWAAGVLADLERASPLAMKVALRHVRDAGALDLRQTLVIDYRLAARMIAAADFREGVRATLVDKDHQPNWRPPSPAEISDAFIDDLFKPHLGSELILPTRQEMQAARI